MSGRMILVLPMYAFLLFCVTLFGWTLLATRVNLSTSGKVIVIVGAASFFVALHAGVGSRWIYQYRNLGSDFRSFARGPMPTEMAARVSWILQRVFILSWVLVAISIAGLLAGLQTGWFLA